MKPWHMNILGIVHGGVLYSLADTVGGTAAKMCIRDRDKEAKAIEDAVQQVLTEGYRTVDIMADGCKQVGTVEMGRLICERIR